MTASHTADDAAPSVPAPSTVWARSGHLRAWAFAFVTAVTGVVAAAYLAIPARPGVPPAEVTPFQVVADVAFVVLTPILGAIIVARRPDIPIGWLFIHIAFWLGLGFVADGFARHAEPTAIAGVIASVCSSASVLGYGCLLLLIQLFPEGRLPTPRWRWLLRATVIAVLVTFGSALLLPPFQPPIPGLPTPLARPEWEPPMTTLNGLATVAIMLILAGTIALLAVRVRHARGVERQQLKWFAWAASIVAMLLVAAIVTGPFGALSGTLWVIATGALVLLPLAATAAILRYRLWAIDRIVSRTLGWAIVTVVLLAVFGAAIVGLQALLSGITHSQTPVVAGSTLVAFALFQPLRRRVQRMVDRRFDRERFDRQRTADAFGERLRDEVSMAVVTADLAATVELTVRPRTVGLWLRAGHDPAP